MPADDATGIIEHLKDALEAIRLSLSIGREVRDAAPSEDQRRALDCALQDAEAAHRLALAEIGKTFGYQLCRCTFPPQVCTRIGYDRDSGAEKSKCPSCGQEYPEPLDPLPSPEISLL